MMTALPPPRSRPAAADFSVMPLERRSTSISAWSSFWYGKKRVPPRAGPREVLWMATMVRRPWGLRDQKEMKDHKEMKVLKVILIRDVIFATVEVVAQVIGVLYDYLKELEADIDALMARTRGRPSVVDSWCSSRTPTG